MVLYLVCFILLLSGDSLTVSKLLYLLDVKQLIPKTFSNPQIGSVGQSEKTIFGVALAYKCPQIAFKVSNEHSVAFPTFRRRMSGSLPIVTFKLWECRCH